MIRTNNYTTFLLCLIVIILLVGVGIAVYYVLELDWFEKKPVDIYKEIQVYKEQPNVETIIKKEIKYDISKRTYDINVMNGYFNVIVYKDGTVGITMLENDKYGNSPHYNKLISEEQKVDLKNIIMAYYVEAGIEFEITNYLLLLDSDGNLYKLLNDEVGLNGKYVFEKIEGIANILAVRQITSANLTENINGANVIAIDKDSNELLITDYLIGDTQEVAESIAE